MMRRSGPALCALLVAAGSIPAAAETYAVRDVRIVPVAGPVVERGTIVLRDGRIAALGRRVRVPSGARMIDGRGLTAYPGLIEAATRLGLGEISSVRATQDGAEQGDLNPQLFAAAAVNPHSELVPVTRVNGVTTILTRPSGGIIPGQAALIDLAGWTVEEMAIRPRAALILDYPGGSGDAQKRRLDAVQKLLKDAQSYVAPGAGSGKAGSLALEALQPYVKGERPVILNADTEAEIRGAVALAEEFKLKYILSGLGEGYKVAAFLKEKDASCLVGGVLAQPDDASAPYDVAYTNPAVLHRAGVRFALVSGETANARNLPYHAAMAAAYGLAADAALAAITLMPARILGIDQDYGSLEPGKVGNLFLATGDPMDPRTQVRALFIRGEPVDLANRHDALYRKFLKRLERAPDAGSPASARDPAAGGQKTR
jgi:imidazolonepropionase-like amidohydrolase